MVILLPIFHVNKKDSRIFEEKFGRKSFLLNEADVAGGLTAAVVIDFKIYYIAVI